MPSLVTAWLDARAPRADAARAVVEEVAGVVEVHGGTVTEESWTDRTTFDAPLAARLAALLGPPGSPAPRLATGAGHDAGILAAAGVPTAMLFVRNPTGVSHAPTEHAERADCHAGVAALAEVAADLSGTRRCRPPVRFWAAHALLPGGPATDVTFAIAPDSAGVARFTAVTPGTAPGDATRLPGVVLPGFADVHSHAFHRALRGRTHDHGGTFWTWRERMYAVAARLDPDSYLALARAAFAERALTGVTAVGEFHYLHHAPDGRPYADPNAMGHALAQAAAEAGVRLTLLDTCYLTADVDGRPVEGVQRRFSDGSVQAWAERVAALRDGPGLRIGVAAHSVRAVPRAALPVVAEVATGARCTSTCPSSPPRTPPASRRTGSPPPACSPPKACSAPRRRPSTPPT